MVGDDTILVGEATGGDGESEDDDEVEGEGEGAVVDVVLEEEGEGESTMAHHLEEGTALTNFLGFLADILSLPVSALRLGTLWWFWVFFWGGQGQTVKKAGGKGQEGRRATTLSISNETNSFLRGTWTLKKKGEKRKPSKK